MTIPENYSQTRLRENLMFSTRLYYLRKLREINVQLKLRFSEQCQWKIKLFFVEMWRNPSEIVCLLPRT